MENRQGMGSHLCGVATGSSVRSQLPPSFLGEWTWKSHIPSLGSISSSVEGGCAIDWSHGQTSVLA